MTEIAKAYRNTPIHTYSNGSMSTAFFVDYPTHNQQLYQYNDGVYIPVTDARIPHKTDGLRVSCDKDKSNITLQLSHYCYTDASMTVQTNSNADRNPAVTHAMVSFPANVASDICQALIQMGFGK